MSDMEKRTYKMTFRVTEKEAEFLKAVAGAEGRPVGNLIRSWMFLHYMEKLKLTPEEVTAMKEKMELEFISNMEILKKKKGRGEKAA